jgi:phenylalanyl-tRNA synthetase beta chain
MKVSLEWLRDYVDLPADLTPAQLMHDLTLSTVEVEGIHYSAKALQDLCVAEVVQAEPIADTHLTLARVHAGAHGTLQVVCGAANVRTGMRVILALPGASIQPKGAAEPLIVKRVKLRGFDSEGVLCAADEIGLTALFPAGDQRGIVDLLEVSEPAGTALATAIGYDDAILEIDNKSLTNRPDLWGHHGIARELAAIYRVPVKALPSGRKLPAAAGLLGASDPAICNRFTATVLENVTVTAAPLWLRSRLARVGQRSIDLFVDLTNYVMFATGQPSHAYDADEISTPMTARFGKQGEVLTLLDGSVHEVPGLPCIADGLKVLAAAGVMGGAASGVTAHTRRIFLEMASFQPQVVRKSSQRLAARTEASSRFEKGVDSQRIDGALGLFIELVQRIQPGVVCSGHQDEVNRRTECARISVQVPFINRRLGKSFPAAEIAESLERLGLTVREEGDTLHLTAPSWRSTGDLTLPADIVEEVARLHGYDNFRIVPPRIDLERMPRNKRLPLDRRVREFLACAGLQEVFTYPWANAPLLAAAGMDPGDLYELEAPPGPDQRFLRASLVPNLIEAVALNQHNFEHFGLFEAGAVFPGKIERRHVAGILAGDDLHDLIGRAKGVIDGLMRKVHIAALSQIVGGSLPGWADAATGLVYDKGNDKGDDKGNGNGVAGYLARVGNRSRRAAGIKRGEMVAFEFDLGQLQPHATRENTWAAFPAHPETSFDLTVLAADSVHWVDVQGAVAVIDPRVRSVDWIGEYRGKGVAAGARALTLRVRLGLADRTLTAEESDDVRSRVTALLSDRFKAQPR